MNELSIIIPSYKEYENLLILIPDIIKELTNKNIKFEIIIVDAQISLDDSFKLEKEFKIVYKNREFDDTYSAAVKTGIKWAKYEKILFMDADGSHSPSYIPEMLDLSNCYDVVIGSRYIKNGKTKNNILLVSMSKILNLIYSAFFKLKISDISNSFKIYPTKLISSLELTCKHFDIIEEIIIKLKFYNKNLTIFETPIVFNKRVHGNSKRSFFLFVISYFNTMFKLYLLKLRLNK